MTTLSRDASAARLLLDLTALSVKQPTRDHCVQPPSHQRSMCIFRPRSLVNSRAQDSHLCTRLSFATSASVVALVRVVLWMCITLLFLAEIIIAASAMEPAASDVTRAVACPRVLVYEGGVICILKLGHTDGVRTRADSHARVHVIV